MSLHGGASVFEPANPASNLYFIHRGQVRVYTVGREQSQLIEILGPNDWLGISALTGASSHASRAVTVGQVILSEVPVDRFNALILQHPKAAAELIKQLAQRLRHAREESSRLIFDDCHTRLLRALVKFSHSTAATASQTGVVLHITHLQLAQAIGVARETVSLALKDLRDQNVLKTGRNQVTFEPRAIEQLLVQRLQRAAAIPPAPATPPTTPASGPTAA
jgi:CRP-like cAMP-binding protein